MMSERISLFRRWEVILYQNAEDKTEGGAAGDQEAVDQEVKEYFSLKETIKILVAEKATI